jgi:hypothetical protein
MRGPTPDPPSVLPECTLAEDCASRSCQAGRCQPASCVDGVVNQGESAADCGGPCPDRCVAEQPCAESADCATGLFCPESTLRCTPVSCQDGAQNGDEVGRDCGGGCPGCPVGSPCAANPDCITGACRGGTCAAASCNDQVRNQDETAVDCGGGCAPCTPGASCDVGADCNSAVCSGRGCGPGVDRCCQPPRCNDQVRNGSEPFTDCGNAQCGPCPLGNPCNQNVQCETGLCQNGACRVQPCLDGQRDGQETGTDCGGPDPLCARCDLGEGCVNDPDCGDGSCQSGVCADCGDGARNGSETGIDCGGVCGACGPGQGCALDSECQSGVCQDALCCGGDRVDCTRCARRLAPGNTCNSGGAAAAPVCEAFLQCLQDNADVCPTRLAQGCADAGGPCDPVIFGGDATGGINVASQILGTAQCSF